MLYQNSQLYFVIFRGKHTLPKSNLISAMGSYWPDSEEYLLSEQRPWAADCYRLLSQRTWPSKPAAYLRRDIRFCSIHTKLELSSYTYTDADRNAYPYKKDSAMHIHFHSIFGTCSELHVCTALCTYCNVHTQIQTGSLIPHITQPGVALDSLFDVQHSARFKTINNNNNSSHNNGSSIWPLSLKGVHASKGKQDFYHYYQHYVAASGGSFYKYRFP